MARMTKREKTIVGLFAVVLVFWLLYQFGLADMIDELASERKRLATQRALYQQCLRGLADEKSINEEYAKFEMYSIPRNTDKDPADEFTEYVRDLYRQLGEKGLPFLEQTSQQEIPGIRDYKEILLPMRITTTLDKLTQLLRAFDQQRLLIKHLSISCPPDRDPTLTVKITLSRFVRAEQIPETTTQEVAGN